eukprot:UN34609
MLHCADYISPNDDFTRIGGHSLLIVKMLREVKTIFDVKISAAQFYNGNSTLGELSRLIEQEQSKLTTTPEKINHTKVQEVELNMDAKQNEKCYLIIVFRKI